MGSFKRYATSAALFFSLAGPAFAKDAPPPKGGDTPADAPEDAKEDLDSEVKDMVYVGFQQLPDVARVFVRTSDPIKYTIDNSKPGVIVLVLDNAKVPVFNNTRPLISEYFHGPVTLIEAKPQNDVSPSVRVEIHTRSPYATYKHSQKDTQVNVDFNLK